MPFLDQTQYYLNTASSIVNNAVQAEWQTNTSLSDDNGLHTHDTSVSKFLRGGRLDNLLNAHNKIVNGMEDPSFFAFTFGIDKSFSGLFGDPNMMNLRLYDLNTDRNYSVLTYLQNAISPDTNSLLNDGDLIRKEKNTYANLDSLLMYDNERNVIGTKTGSNVNLTFGQEWIDMSQFVNGFQEIANNHPYMFQSVDGLQDAYKKYYNIHKDSFLGGNDTKIKIKCLESMDLRMSALFDCYFRAVYNHKYRRMNIPRNLLKFDCWLLVHDLRNVRADHTDIMTSINGWNKKVTKDIVNHMSTILFKFKNCYFDIEEIGTMLSTISNAEANQTTFEFAFNYTDIDIYINALADFIRGDNERYGDSDNVYHSTLDINKLNDESRKIPHTELGNMYEDTFSIGGLLAGIGTTILNNATHGMFQPGNVYDKSWAGLLSSMYSSITAAGVRGILNNSIWQPTSMPNHEVLKAGNVYDDVNNSHDQIVSANVYDDAISQHEQLVEDNIFGDLDLSHEPLVQEDIDMSSNATHEQLYNESIDMVVSHHGTFNGEFIDVSHASHAQMNPENIDMSTNATHDTLVATNIYPNISFTYPYISETVDMSTNATHESIGNINVYKQLKGKEKPFFGNVYSFNNSSAKMIPVNVYDRIIKSRTNKNITIDKISVPPTKAPALNTEKNDTLIKETKTSTFEQMNVFTNEAKQKIINQLRSIGNVYLD